MCTEKETERGQESIREITWRRKKGEKEQKRQLENGVVINGITLYFN